MGTIVSIDVVGRASNRPDESARDDAIERAFGWFREVERLCNRFDPRSDVRRLTEHPGVAVRPDETLYAAVEFALAVAEETGGAFDPTVGYQMEARGFNRDYRSGGVVRTSPAPHGPVTYRNVHVDPASRTVTIDRPLVLDLGAVAKGLAVDLAARELAPFENFAIDAGGDLYLAGRNANGDDWSVGIRHPRRDREAIELVRVSDAAVCTSGDYERPAPGGEAGHHIIDPRGGTSANVVVSATVIAPTAMLADALATAAFVLGPDAGIALLERHGVDGLLLSPTLERFATRGMRSDGSQSRETGAATRRGPAILPHA